MQDLKSVAILKALVIDTVHQAKSGHPGGAMSSADFAYLLFKEQLNFDPQDPHWLGRDRFILSAGHESALLYGLLHLQSYLSLDEIKRFRQWGSLTPGHPESHLTPGVECTTGPLGQGAAMSVGFALQALRLKAEFGPELYSQKIWALLGDGDMQEDLSLGAAALAGHWALENLIWYYDANEAQISGPTKRSSSEDFSKIFEGLGWEVLTLAGNDHTALRQAFERANAKRQRPLLLIGQSRIAFGAATQEGSAETHGAPLSAAEREATKKRWGLPLEDFYTPAEWYQSFRQRDGERGLVVKAWREAKAKLDQNPELKARWDRLHTTDIPELPWPEWAPGKELATRNAFGDCLSLWASSALPSLVGGSADLEPSNMTGAFAKKVGDFTRDQRQGRNLCFGVREFPMAAIANGIALFGGAHPFTATFLSFSDYSRPALRLGAIQGLTVIHEFSHDSFYLGEDGPTHQPIEHLMSLRLIPNFYVMRPADAQETKILFEKALSLKGPTALCLSRQKLPLLDLPLATIKAAQRGAYTVYETAELDPEYVLIATGSEVHLALQVAKKLSPRAVRVVSMPCWELFMEQPLAYRQVLIPPLAKKISLEAASRLGWERWVGPEGLIIGIDHFGASAPAEALEEAYGFKPEVIYEAILNHSFS